MSQRGQKYRVRLGFDYRLNLPKVVGSAGFEPAISSDLEPDPETAFFPRLEA